MFRQALCAASLFVTAACSANLFGQEDLQEDPTSEVLSELLTELDLVDVALQDQPIPPTPDPAPRSARPARTSRRIAMSTRYRRSRTRLARAPSIFGDFIDSGSLDLQTETTEFDIPMAGGSRRVKISEHNKALPDDRVFFHYNHFHNALNVAESPFPGAPLVNTDAFSIDRYLFGAEKTFLDGDWSVELRIPFNNGLDYSNPNFQLAGGEVGDLSLILKHLLYLDDTTAISAGLAINTPTGSDVQVVLPLQSPSPVEFALGNEAVHLMPFAGFLCNPESDFYCHGFVQVDVATTGNPAVMTDGTGPILNGRLNDQTLLYVDASAGYWLFRDSGASCLTAAALAVEFHYTTALQDADEIAFPSLDLGSRRNRFDVVNATVGLHLELHENTNLRVGGVFPLADERSRFFDSEVQAAVIRRF